MKTLQTLLHRGQLWVGGSHFKALVIALILTFTLLPTPIPVPVMGPALVQAGDTDATPPVLDEEGGAMERFTNLFRRLRQFAVILLFIGVVAAALMFAMGQKQMALNVIVAVAVLFGVTAIMELVIRALQEGGGTGA